MVDMLYHTDLDFLFSKKNCIMLRWLVFEQLREIKYDTS